MGGVGEKAKKKLNARELMPRKKIRAKKQVKKNSCSNN